MVLRTNFVYSIMEEMMKHTHFDIATIIVVAINSYYIAYPLLC